MIYADVPLNVIVFLSLKLSWRHIFIAAKANAVIFELSCPNFIENFFAGAVFKKANIHFYAASTGPICLGIVEVFTEAGIFHTPVYVVNISDLVTCRMA